MEMESSLKTILYMTVNTVNNKIYVGIHITENPYKFDGYYGDGITGTSSSWFKHPKYPFQRACKKYGLDAFKRYTLQVFDNYDDARKAEAFIVNEEFIKRSDTYNVALGGGCGLVPSIEIEVHQYDLDGNYIKTYRSKSDAARKNNISIMSIHRAILNKSICAGYYWSETKLFKLNIEEMSKSQKKPVYIYNMQGEFIEQFESFSSCAKKLDVCLSGVQKAINSQTKCNGFYISLEKVDKFIKTPKTRKRHNIVYQYNLNGKYIQECTFDQVKAICGKEYSKFRSAIREGYSCANFLWSYNKLESISPCNKNQTKKIYQYDLKGNLIKVWDSYRECCKQFSNLREVLKGVRSQTKGFTFTYTKL